MCTARAYLVSFCIWAPPGTVGDIEPLKPHDYDFENRGRLVWILASSRPDLIEVDLKRPGRIDLKIPIFPTVTPEEGYQLLCSLAKRYELEFAPSYEGISVPDLLTPGAAESIMVKVYRLAQTTKVPIMEALKQCLSAYQSPVLPEVMDAQIRLAIQETSDMEFVPEKIRERFAR